MLRPERSTADRTLDPRGALAHRHTARAVALAELADYIELHAAALQRALSRHDPLDPDAVHELRVHARRLARALRLAGYIVDIPPQARKALRSLVDRLADLRDAQVAKGRISKGWTEAEARKLDEHLRAESGRLKRRARRHLARYEATAPSRLYDDAAALLRSESKAPPRAGPDAAIMLGEVARAFLDLERRTRNLDPENGRSLHRLRIALRRYRYDIESLPRLLSAGGTERLPTLERAQELLGEARDAEVTRLAVIKHSGKASPALRRAWRLLAEQQLTAARNRVVEFLEHEQPGLCTWNF